MICGLIAILAIPGAFAEVKLPAIIGSHMVLQTGQENPIWGWASPGEEVTVSIAGQEKSTKADDQGNWKVTLDSIQSESPLTLKVSGKNTIELKDILVGEVWVCSGQSNMEWTVERSNDAENEIKNADYPKIRLFQAQKAIAGLPQKDTTGEWKLCSPQSIPGFTAVGYFFGRELHKELDVPVGLIQSAWGGTPSESWTTKESLAANEISVPIIERWDQVIENYPQEIEGYKKQIDEWMKTSGEEEEAGKPVSGAPSVPRDPRANPHRYSGLYNGMIAPLIPYGIRGAIWYQGESNASRAYQYRTIFPMMIEDWRREWGQGDFPFYFVQLANFREVFEEPRDNDWAELREAQTMTLDLPNTGMAVIIDIGEAGDIHPRNKQDVGKRLALNAFAQIHGKDVTYSGPMFKSMKIEGGKATLSFDHVDGGLMAKSGGELKGFAIAGADKKFVWANAKIEGDKVVVSSDEVKEPVAVRYAWDTNPVANLFNKAGLPASPFRTDDWPGVTDENR
ncbi:MAG: sialate O-acetylesterase [Candidatus Omnitrophica bacterium]|nr:sialate O-acetylesterase [Candidatus Omnitrophota bacterium]